MQNATDNTTTTSTTYDSTYQTVWIYDSYHTDERYITDMWIGRTMGLLSTIASLYIIQDIVKKIIHNWRHHRGHYHHHHGQSTRRSSLFAAAAASSMRGLGLNGGTGGGRGAGGAVRRRSSHSNKQLKVCDKIVLALSVCDVLFSFFGCFLASWPAPKGQAYGASGNVAICSVVGWFQNWGFVCSKYYNASLALCYLFMVRYNQNESQLRKRSQYIFLLTPILLNLPWQILSIAWQGGNFNGAYCTALEVYPLNCDVPGMECIRGQKIANLFQADPYELTYFVIVCQQSIFSFPIVVTSMALIYRTVNEVERRNDTHRFEERVARANNSTEAFAAAVTPTIVNGEAIFPDDSISSEGNNGSDDKATSSRQRTSSNRSLLGRRLAGATRRTRNRTRLSQVEAARRKYSNLVAWQGIWYVVAFLAVELPYWTIVMLYEETPVRYARFGVLLIPSQGLFNALVYQRPKILAYLDEHYADYNFVDDFLVAYWKRLISCCACTTSNLDKNAGVNEQERHIDNSESEEKQEQDSQPTKRSSSNDDADMAISVAATAPATETTNITFQTDISTTRNDENDGEDLAIEPLNKAAP